MSRSSKPFSFTCGIGFSGRSGVKKSLKIHCAEPASQGMAFLTYSSLLRAATLRCSGSHRPSGCCVCGYQRDEGVDCRDIAISLNDQRPQRETPDRTNVYCFEGTSKAIAQRGTPKELWISWSCHTKLSKSGLGFTLVYFFYNATYGRMTAQITI